MNHKVKVIKRSERNELDDLEPPKQPEPHPTRDITTTIKLWVSEYKQKQRARNASNPLTRVAA